MKYHYIGIVYKSKENQNHQKPKRIALESVLRHT